jgi:hypothetical protein
VNLNAGFTPDPQVVAGTSGGQVAAQGVDASCRGFIPASPSHVLVTQSGFRFLRVFVESQGDTTLMVRGVAGTFCADDTYGLNPGLDLTGLLPNTRYDIYVGSYSQGASNPYRLTFSELQESVPGSSGNQANNNNNNANNGNGNGNGHAPPPTLNPPTPPVFGRIAITSQLRTARFSTGRTGGSVNAAQIHGRGVCRGYVTDPPSFIMNITEEQRFMRMFVNSAQDTTLVVQFPDGSFVCNDDSFNTLHPSIDDHFVPGVYYVWVGIYREGAVHPFRLTVTPNAGQHP